jgi:DNA-binding transcriptional MerR regulator
MPAETVPIPNRSLFRHNEVCEIAQVQPYVLRSWEAEFPDLGVTKGKDGPRVYRRGDVERVLRIKHLLFVEGLTLAGARRRIQEERGERSTDDEAPLETLLKSDARERILRVRQSLRELASMLARQPGASVIASAAEFELAAPAPRAKRPGKPIVKSAAKSAKRRAAAR